MYLHIGGVYMIQSSSIVGIFDLDNTSVSIRTREFLASMQKNNKIVNACEETALPKSFVLCSDKNREIGYLSQLAPATLFKRAGLPHSGMQL